MAAMAATPAPQPEQVNYSGGAPAAREDTMIGNDLIVEIPWIVFGLLLAAVCLRLPRFRRFSGLSRDRESQQAVDDGNDSSATTGEPARNDHHGPAVPSSTLPSSTQH
jgi:hypothetical protein